MKDFDFVLYEIVSNDDILMHYPRIITLREDGKLYRVVFRSLNSYSVLVSFVSYRKKYPSVSWCRANFDFELTCFQDSLFSSELSVDGSCDGVALNDY